MIGYKAICVAGPLVPLIDMLECVQEVFTILIVFEDWLLFITPGGYVINCAGVFYSKGTGHAATAVESDANFKEKDMTLR